MASIIAEMAHFLDVSLPAMPFALALLKRSRRAELMHDNGRGQFCVIQAGW